MKNSYMIQLTANKTKLYNLVKGYFPEIPGMRSTQFIKYPRCRDYALDFCHDDVYHHYYLAVCGGRPTLGHKAEEYDDNGDSATTWETTTLKLEDLDKLGLLERVEV